MRRLRVALIRNGMGIFACFPLLRIIMNYVVELFELEFSLKLLNEELIFGCDVIEF